MIPRHKSTEVKRFASKAINLLKDEGISRQEAIETVQALVQTTDKPLMIENGQAYPRLPQDAVTHIVVDTHKLDSEDKTLYI